MIAALAAVAVVGLLAAGKGRRGGRTTSAREDAPEEEADVDNGTADTLRELSGAPYYWGGHETSAADKDDTVSTWEEARALLKAGATGWGLDCSLYVSLALARLGIVPRFVRKTSKQLAADCDPVPWGQQRAGDIAYYPGHVMMVLEDARADGDSAVIGASGGGSSTFGDDPNARVKEFTSARYRGDFVTFMRPKVGAW